MMINTLLKVNIQGKSINFKDCSGAKTLNYSEESYKRLLGITLDDNTSNDDVSSAQMYNNSFIESNDSLGDNSLLNNNNSSSIKSNNSIEDSFSEIQLE